MIIERSTNQSLNMIRKYEQKEKKFQNGPKRFNNRRENNFKEREFNQDRYEYYDRPERNDYKFEKKVRFQTKFG